MSSTPIHDQQTVTRAGYSSASVPSDMQRQLETNLQLHGAVAIQDDLVSDVFISIKKLQTAGVRFWILTGDKADTAEAIALTAGVIDPSQELVRLTAANLLITPSQSLRDTLLEVLTEYSESNSHNSILVDESVMDVVFEETPSESTEAQAVITDVPSLKQLFLGCLCSSQSVIIARMRKDQKQAITMQLKEYGKLVGFKDQSYGKTSQSIHVLCVGDGANDIGMIRESDIGIGIKGKEGLQAYNNCDVGLPSFRYISKLLFVHGKSNEMRLQTLILYFLYKNTLLSIITLLLSYITVFSGLKVMPSWGIDFYNT